MANEKTYMARTQMKCDSAANWQKATNFSPLKGEMIIYNGDPPRLKVGDGTTNVNNLPFTTAAIYVGDAAPTGDYDLWVDTSAGTGDGTVQVVIFTQEEKTKLAGIEAGANKYVLPTAGADLGGVKTTSTVSDATGLTATPIIEGVPYYKETTPNWNENDSTSKGYIDNRPGAFTKTETITLTTTAKSNDSSATTTASLTFAFPDERMDLIPGETYQVVWDGQTYNWEAKVFYADFSTNETSTTYRPGFTSLYLICGHMPRGDATDSFPITVVSAGGSFYVTDMQKGALLVGSNGTSFTVGTSYSITITGKFDYKLYSRNGNNIYATGIFDNAALEMAINYTNGKIKQIDYRSLLNKPDGHLEGGTHILTFTGDGSTSAECEWAENIDDFAPGNQYEITFNNTTYTLIARVTSNNLASNYDADASGYGTAIGKISLIDENYTDTSDEANCPFVIYTDLMSNSIYIQSSSVFENGTDYRVVVEGYLVCRNYSSKVDTSTPYPTLFFDNFTYNHLNDKISYIDQWLRNGSWVEKTGDTMTGALTIDGADLSIKGEYYPSFNLTPTNASSKIKKAVFEGSLYGAVSMSAWEDDSGQNRRILEVRAKAYESSLDDSLLLRVCDSNNWSQYKVFHEGMSTVEFGGTAIANTNAQKTLSTAQLRNITISTTDLVEGESTLAEGEIYLVYDGGEA